MKNIYTILSILILSFTSLQAQTELFNETLRTGSLPGGWSQSSIVFETAAGGYARFSNVNATLTTPVFDASAFSTLTVAFNVAKFGSGGDGPITVQYSLNGGATWQEMGDSPIPTNADYLSASIDNSNLSANMQIRFIRSKSASQKRLRDVVISVTGASCADPTWFYRTKGNSNWGDGTNWEASPNGINNWEDANCPPDYQANTITIQSGHTINITSDLTIDQTVIESGATLVRAGGHLTINNGPGDDIIVYGTFRHGASLGQPTFNGTMRIMTDGVLEITNNQTAASPYGRSNSIYWEDGSIYHWNVSSNAVFQTANATYFPNAQADQIPIFRVTTPNLPNVGANSTTRVNGIFEMTQNTVTWVNSGNKVFRNGLGGDGNIVQASSSGRFVLDGQIAYLFGSGQINLDTDERLQTDGAVYVQLLSDKTINNGQLRITNPATLDAQAFELSGSADVRFNNRATLRTQHPNGVDGSLSGMSQVNFVTDREQTVVFERNGPQNSGTSIFPSSLGAVEVLNGSQLSLQQDLEISELSNGYFLIDGIGSTLIANSTVEIDIRGNRSFVLQNGATMDDSCLENLRFETGGNSSTATFTGNGATIKCWNFTSVKNESGGLILSPNTPLNCYNNFQVDYDGGTAVFVDNENVITVGDDVRLKGSAANFDFTGTLILTLENSGSGQADIEVDNGVDNEAIRAELHNLIINNTSNGSANVRFQPTDGSGEITIKNDFTIQAMESGTQILLGSNTINIGGDYTNLTHADRLNEGTSTLNFNRNGNQHINMPDEGEHFYNLILSGSDGEKILNNEDIFINNNLLITGNDTRLSQPNNTQFATNGCDHYLYIAGDITLENNGGFANNCFDNLEISTIGNQDQVFSGNGSPFLCFNFRSDKSDGNLTLASNTPVVAKNNFRVKFDGSNHVFSDDGNTITLGDDLILTGPVPRFNLTGTFVMTGENGGTNDIEDEDGSGMQAELNNLVIQGSGTNNHTRIRPNNGTHTLVVKGDVIIQENTSGLPSILNTQGNDINVGGSWINKGELLTSTGSTPPFSTVTFNGNGTQLVDAGGDQNGKRFYNVVKTNTSTALLESDIAIENDFTLLNGNWDVSTNDYEMFIQRNWTHSGGTFGPRNALVTFYGDIDSEIIGVNFNRLEVEKNNESLDVRTQNSFEIDEKLHVETGNFIIRDSHIIDARRVEIRNTSSELLMENGSRLNVNP